MNAELATLFAYDDWANREALASLKGANAAPPRAVDVMAHIVGCQWLWLGRLQRASNPAIVWPQLSLDDCAEQLKELAAAWREYLNGLTTTDLAQSVDYTNSQGEYWASGVQDILLHVVFHSGYHRGQIAMQLGRSGQQPAYTDFIHCIRQGLIDR